MKAQLDESGLTQTQLGERAGSTQSDVSRFFTGQMRYPPLDFLDALSRVLFKKRLSDLLGEDLPPTPNGVQGPDEDELLACYRKIAPASRKIVRDLVLQWSHDATAGSSAGTPDESMTGEPEASRDTRKTGRTRQK